MYQWRNCSISWDREFNMELCDQFRLVGGGIPVGLTNTFMGRIQQKMCMSLAESKSQMDQYMGSQVPLRHPIPIDNQNVPNSNGMKWPFGEIPDIVEIR